jgi:hypothetical protein
VVVNSHSFSFLNYEHHVATFSMKTEAVCSSDTLVPTYEYTRRHNTEDYTVKSKMSLGYNWKPLLFLQQ